MCFPAKRQPTDDVYRETAALGFLLCLIKTNMDVRAKLEEGMSACKTSLSSNDKPSVSFLKNYFVTG